MHPNVCRARRQACISLTFYMMRDSFVKHKYGEKLCLNSVVAAESAVECKSEACLF